MEGNHFEGYIYNCRLSFYFPRTRFFLDFLKRALGSTLLRFLESSPLVHLCSWVEREYAKLPRMVPLVLPVASLLLLRLWRVGVQLSPGMTNDLHVRVIEIDREKLPLGYGLPAGLPVCFRIQDLTLCCVRLYLR